MIGSVARSAFECDLAEALIRLVLEKGDSLASSVKMLDEITGGAPARAIRVWGYHSSDGTTREGQIVEALLAHGGGYLADAAASGEVEIEGLNNSLQWVSVPPEAFSIGPVNFDFVGNRIAFRNGQRRDAVRVRFVAGDAASETPVLPARSSIEHSTDISVRRKTGPKYSARDAAIERLLGNNLEPSVPWKEFACQVRDEADGWTTQKKTNPKVGYSTRAIQRAVAEIRKEKR